LATSSGVRSSEGGADSSDGGEAQRCSGSSNIVIAPA
jgi:hypothetical protein